MRNNQLSLYQATSRIIYIIIHFPPWPFVPRHKKQEHIQRFNPHSNILSTAVNHNVDTSIPHNSNLILNLNLNLNQRKQLKNVHFNFHRPRQPQRPWLRSLIYHLRHR